MLTESVSASGPRAAPLELWCAHCNEPVPASALDPGGAQQFCCAGCRSVFAILHGSALGAYYRHREESGVAGQPPRSTGRAYAELDQPEFTERSCQATQGGLLGTDLYLEGVHCSACVWLIERVPSITKGLMEARLDASRGIVRVVWDPAKVPLSRIAATLDSLGYPCHPVHGLDREGLRRREDRALLMRLGVAGAAAGNAMMLAVALYTGALQGMDPALVQLFRWGSAAVAVPAVFWSAGVFYKGALAAIRTRSPHMDLPISIGILAGAGSGAVNTFRSHGEIYFDTITMLIFLLLVGRYLLQRQQRRADVAVELLQALAPASARLVEGSTVREVPVDAVPVGALVEVRAGEHVPVDGVVFTGTSSIDASLLTGESAPEDVTVGSPVHAGSVNLSSPLLVRAEATGQSTRIARIAASVAEAARSRAPIVATASRLSGYFVLTVLLAAVVTVLGWWRFDPTRAVERGVALLVVTCPCALALATPLALTAALGRAARAGLLVKGGEFLEALARPGLIVFDKTGTLTEGRLALMDYAGDASTQGWVAAVEGASAHPIARALAVGRPRSPGMIVGEVRETLGGGIEATVNGREVVVGSLAFVRDRAGPLPSWVLSRCEEYAARCWTPVLIADGGLVLAVAALGDPVRAEARASLEELIRAGYRLAILSGDQTAVVRAVADRIGVPFEEVVGGASPEAKLAFIRLHAARGPVFMVGDGVNDTAALSAATVGIAVHGGAEASLAAADVFATQGGLTPIVELFRGSGRALRVIRFNLARSLTYNLTVGALAATGFVGPLLAAVLMPVSSILVVTSAYRARTFGSGP